jgi:dienelactone hydrolase
MLRKLLIAGCMMGVICGSNGQDFREAPEKYWNYAELSRTPQFRESPYADSKCEGLRDVLIQGAPVNGQPAEFFAYYGYPETPMPKGGYPAVLLIHGGGGTAFPQYTKLWIKQGYVVMALDWYNQRPLTSSEKPTETNVARAELEGGRRQNHVVNVANMVLAHSLLRTLDKVNPEKTVFVGLSWGSWYGAMVAAVDPRFKGGIEIYCGDVKRDSTAFINGRFHHAAKVPLYWVVGTNDQNATPVTSQAGFDECAKLENHSLVIRLSHSHIGFEFPSCFRMAEYFLEGGSGLPKLSRAKIDGNVIRADILSQGKGITHAILCYTEDAGEQVTHKRLWKSIPAQVSEGSIQAELPKGVHQCFLSAYDEKSRFNDLCGSTNLIEFPALEKSEE